MRYYKGNVIEKAYCWGETYKLVFDHVGIDDKSYILNWNTSYKLKEYLKHRNGDYEKINTSLRDICRSVGNKKELDNFFLSFLKPDINEKDGNIIYYEKLYDNDGNCYGRELLTGLLFPIRYDYDDYDIQYDYETKDAGVASIKYEYSISVNPKIISPPDTRIECVIVNEKVANQEELSLYYKKYGKKIGFIKNDYIKKITKMANSNYLGENIRFVDQKTIIKEKIKEPELTKEMQELEFLLLKLKRVSPDDYNIINGEYERLLNQGSENLNINPLTIKSIINLEVKVKVAFLLNGGDSKSIYDYLEKQVGLYLDSIINNKPNKTELTISELDDIEERIILAKDVYSPKEQNKLLRLIALIYFLELYENINEITSNDLENSYVIDNLKRIIIVINTFKEEGIIESDDMIFDIKSIDELLGVIKKIEFNNKCLKEKEEVLVKRIQQ